MKSYLRFLSRNKLYTAIEVVGLSVALAFVIIMSCFVWQNMSVNRHYPDQDRIYAIGTKGSLMSNAYIAETMVDAIPELECGTTVLRLTCDPHSIDGNLLKRESYMSIEKNFFEMFPTRFIYGSEDVLNNPSNAIVTESLAKEFGGEDIIGKTLLFEGVHKLIIAAVIEDFDDTIFQNEQVIVNIGHESQHRWKGGQNSNIHVSSSGVLALVKAKKDADETVILDKMDRIYENGISDKNRKDSYLSLTRLDKAYTSDNNEGEYTGLKKGNAGLMTAFSIIVVFLLISAVFNYINLNTALAGRRSKEIATRMLLGEDRMSIFKRNLLESMGFMITCMCIAFIIARACLPYVNGLLDSPIPVQMKFSHGYIYMYIIILGVTALFCGIIPAFISFRFQPIEIIKGSYRYQSKRTFSKVFIIIQNIIAIIIIAMSMTMNSQIRHMIDMPMNANTEGLFICRTFSGEFEKTLRELPYVAEFGRCQGRPGMAYGSYGFELEGDVPKEVSLDICECDSAAFELFGFKIVKDYGVPMGQGAWLTETAVRELGMDPENPVFPSRYAWAINYNAIAGIIEDVPFSSAMNLNPDAGGFVLKGPQDPDWSDYIVRLSDSSAENIKELTRLCEEEIVRVHGRSIPVSSGYYPDLIEEAYEPIKKQAKMVTLFMIVAILLSALGQIAMSTYYATEKEKEIGIRKVFGGTVRSESIRNIFEYLAYCVIACIIAVPVSVWIAGRYLETFVYKMPQKPWIFVAAALMVFAVSLASVLWQTLRAARTNPAEALKKE
ncbi:MAG: hypothetical protein IJN26_07525 [Bacteroidales bacterium]|nr:hypothetical protein [Bacteroidales bacterium]